MNIMSDKKALSRIILSVLAVGFIAAASIFSFLFIKNIFTEELLPPITEPVVYMLEHDYGNDTSLITTINEQTNNMRELDFKLDFIFLIAWMSSIILSVLGSFKLPKMNKLEVLTFLFVGILLILVLMNYLDQIFTWFVTQFIINVFNTTDTYLPIFSFYVENFIIINLVHFMFLILVNQFAPRKEEELTLDDNEDTQFQPVEEDTQFQPIQQEEVKQ